MSRRFSAVGLPTLGLQFGKFHQLNCVPTEFMVVLWVLLSATGFARKRGGLVQKYNFNRLWSLLIVPVCRNWELKVLQKFWVCLLVSCCRVEGHGRDALYFWVPHKQFGVDIGFTAEYGVANQREISALRQPEFQYGRGLVADFVCVHHALLPP